MATTAEIQQQADAVTAGTAYVFAKTFVRDLDAMGRFYAEVFGLVENNRHTDVMFGRPISEITYRPSAPRESGGLTLISYLDGDTPPQSGKQSRDSSPTTSRRCASAPRRQAVTCPIRSAQYPNSASGLPLCSTRKVTSTK